MVETNYSPILEHVPAVRNISSTGLQLVLPGAGGGEGQEVKPRASIDQVIHLKHSWYVSIFINEYN